MAFFLKARSVTVADGKANRRTCNRTLVDEEILPRTVGAALGDISEKAVEFKRPLFNFYWEARRTKLFAEKLGRPSYEFIGVERKDGSVIANQFKL